HKNTLIIILDVVEVLPRQCERRRRDGHDGRRDGRRRQGRRGVFVAVLPEHLEGRRLFGGRRRRARFAGRPLRVSFVVHGEEPAQVALVPRRRRVDGEGRRLYVHVRRRQLAALGRVLGGLGALARGLLLPAPRFQRELLRRHGFVHFALLGVLRHEHALAAAAGLLFDNLPFDERGALAGLARRLLGLLLLFLGHLRCLWLLVVKCWLRPTSRVAPRLLLAKVVCTVCDGLQLSAQRAVHAQTAGDKRCTTDATFVRLGSVLIDLCVAPC
ncbi:unnamed protein product, partial [Pelagomonas calceolata]